MNYSYKNFLFLKKGFYKRIQANVLSSSMEPWINLGERVTVKTCKPEDLKPCDIILFWRKNIFICHVFLRVEENFLITKPLSGNKIDPPSHISNLLGVVVTPSFPRFQRYLLRFLSRNAR